MTALERAGGEFILEDVFGILCGVSFDRKETSTTSTALWAFGIVEGRRGEINWWLPSSPTRPDVAKPHDALAVNQHLEVGKCAHSERSLHPPVAVPILRPNHLVLGDERPPLFRFAVRADPDHHERGSFSNFL